METIDYREDDFFEITVTQFNELPKGTVLFSYETNGFLIKGLDLFLFDAKTGIIKGVGLTAKLVKTQNLEKTVFIWRLSH